jgi:hypothetical protein
MARPSQKKTSEVNPSFGGRVEQQEKEMPMKRFLTPQEKKVLRYEKDQRNPYAEPQSPSI